MAPESKGRPGSASTSPLLNAGAIPGASQRTLAGASYAQRERRFEAGHRRQPDAANHMTYASPTYVEETRLGFRFLATHTWQHHVLRVAINDLKRLVGEPLPQGGVLLDAGCGQGKSFRLLRDAFAPELIAGDCAHIDLADASVDVLFCHQTFHHLVEQEHALAEFWRVLKPDGRLLFAESTKAYIDSWVIRWFFRHPMHVQKSADGYLAMLRAQGFEFGD